MDLDKRLKAEEEQEEAEKKRKKRLHEDHAKQLASMPKLNLFEDHSLDSENDLEKEDIENFDYDNCHLGLSEDDFDQDI